MADTLNISSNVVDGNGVSADVSLGVTINTSVNESTSVSANVVTGGKGDDGVGVPSGGTAGQVLAKIDSTPYNTQWVAQAGGGTVISVAGKTGVVTLDKTDVGLSNVDNTSDLGKPISTLTQTALNTKEPTITAGTTAQYYRGDKTFQTLNQDAVPDGTTNKAFTATEKTKLAAITGTNTGDQTTITGNAGSATILQTSRTIGTLTGDVTSTGSSFNGSANNTNATTLATVNSNVGSFGSATQTPTYTVNAKGLITASSNTTIQIAESQVTNLVTDLAGKQGTLTLTTVGSSGASTLIGNTLNIPNYAGGGGSSGITRSIFVTSGNVTAGSTALVDYVYLIAGAHTVTLPTAVGNTNRYTLKNNHTSPVALAFTGGETADGGGITLAPFSSVDLISTNTSWSII